MNYIIASIVALTLSVGGFFGYQEYQQNFGTLSVLKASQGGTGIGTATAGDVGKVLKVTNNSPFTFELATDNTGGGGGGSGTVSTSTNETAGFLSYWTSNSGTPALLGQVATGTISSANSALTVTGSRSAIGGAAVFTIATTSNNMFSGTAGQVLAFLDGGWVGVATTTLSNISGVLSVAKGGTGLTTFGGTNRVLYTTSADTLASEDAFVYDQSNDTLGVNNISSIAAATLAINAGGGNLNLAGADVAVSSTAGSYQAILDTTNLTVGDSRLFFPDTASVDDTFCLQTLANCGSGGGGSPGGTGTELQYRAGASTFGAVSSAYDSSGSGRLGIGTTTMQLPVLTIASTTGPQLGLSYGAGVLQWIVRNNNGRFSIASTTVGGTAEAAIPQFSINGTTGNVGIRSTSPIGALEVRPATDGPDVLNIAKVDGTRSFSLGTFPGDPSYVGFWGGTATPGATNYSFLTDGASETVFNVPGAGSALYFRVNNSTVFSARQTEVGIGTGSTNVANTLTVAGNGSFGTSLASVSAPTSGLLVEGETRIGTTTQGLTSRFTSFHDTAPQLVLSNRAGIAQWAFRNAGGNLYLATTTVAGTATTSPSAFSILGSSGNVGIGTTTPEFKLAVQFFDDDNMFQLYDTDGNCLQNPEAGGITTTCTSDARLKKNIRDAAPTLDWINRFIVRDYELKSTNDTVTGIIAQEIQNTHPELYEEIQGELFVKEPSVWKVIKAIQELSSKNDTQDDRLAVIEARLEAVEKELAVYKNMCLLR